MLPKYPSSHKGAPSELMRGILAGGDIRTTHKEMYAYTLGT